MNHLNKGTNESNCIIGKEVAASKENKTDNKLEEAKVITNQDLSNLCKILLKQAQIKKSLGSKNKVKESNPKDPKNNQIMEL